MTRRLVSTEVAEILRVSPAHARLLARRGEIRASYAGRQWLYDPEAVDEYLAEHSNRGSATTARRRRRRSA